MQTSKSFNKRRQTRWSTHSLLNTQSCYGISLCWFPTLAVYADILTWGQQKDHIFNRAESVTQPSESKLKNPDWHRWEWGGENEQRVTVREQQSQQWLASRWDLETLWFPEHQGLLRHQCLAALSKLQTLNQSFIACPNRAHAHKSTHRQSNKEADNK